MGIKALLTLLAICFNSGDGTAGDGRSYRSLIEEEEEKKKEKEKKDLQKKKEDLRQKCREDPDCSERLGEIEHRIVFLREEMREKIGKEEEKIENILKEIQYSLDFTESLTEREKKMSSLKLEIKNKTRELNNLRNI